MRHGGGRAGPHEWGWVEAGYDLTDQEFTELVEDLTGDNFSLRVATLQVLWEEPSGDKRILPHLERFLHDKTPCLLGVPYIFGEIRWLAAQALAAEREVQGMTEPVYLQNIVKPIYTEGISLAEKAAGVEFKWGVEGVLENLAILRDMGYLPMYDLELWPRRSQEMGSAIGTQKKARQLEFVPA